MDMYERITKEIERVNRELEEKLERAKHCDIDVRDIFTDEDFDQLCRRNKEFVGKVANWSNVQKNKKLSLAAEWMFAHCIDVEGYKVEPVSKEKPNAVVCLDMSNVTALKGDAMRVFTYMSVISDTVLFGSVDEKFIRFTFTIHDAWSGEQEEERK